MITIPINTEAPNQAGFIPDIESSGTGNIGELFSQDANMALWIRPVTPSDNPLVIWNDDYVAGDIYYLSIGNVDDRPTGGTFTLTLSGTTAPIAYNVTAADLSTVLNALSVDDGYGGVTVTQLVEGVFQVDWTDLMAVPAMTGDPALLIPASKATVTQVRAGSASEHAQQIIDLKQSEVASATVSTAYSPDGVTVTLITAPSDTTNAVWTVAFNDAYDGYLTLTITANGVTSSVNVTPFMSASDFGVALALHPEIYYQDVSNADNVAVAFVDGQFIITFIGTLAGSTTQRTISNITADTLAVVTTTADHGYVTGDIVVISGSDSTPSIDGSQTVTVLSPTTFSVPVTTTVAGTTGSIYSTTQPDIEFDEANCVFPKGNTGELDLNTFALAKAFWNTTDDEITYSFQIKRTRTSGESKTIFADSIVLKRELIDIGTMIDVPTTGLQSITLGHVGVANGSLILVNTADGDTVTVTVNTVSSPWTLTLPSSAGTSGQVLTTNGSGVTSWQTNGTGTVSSVSFTGGIVSVATATTTPALTVAGTSGGIPYFSSSSTWATSAVLSANSLVKGGGAGVAPSTITTGTGVLTALGVNVGSPGAFVTFNGAGGTPSSLTLTNATGLPLTSGVTGTLPVANGGTGVTSRPCFAAYCSSPTTLTSGASTKVAFATEDFDVANNYDTTNSRFTAPIAGKYEFNFTIIVSGNLGANSEVYFAKNGTKEKSPYYNVSDPNSLHTITGTTMINLAANDYVEVFAYNDSGSSRTAHNYQVYTQFSGRFITS